MHGVEAEHGVEALISICSFLTNNVLIFEPLRLHLETKIEKDKIYMYWSLPLLVQ